jgi:acetoacetate decarboxylase
MEIQDILQQPSMPIASPSYPKGPYRFINREYFIVTYESDPEAIRHAVPEPLEPDGSNHVMYEFISMPDSSGFGSYFESGVVIPAQYKGEKVNFTAQMYLDCEPPIAAGREIWGFPKKRAHVKLGIAHDTLTGIMEYAGQLVAKGTMSYKHINLIRDDAMHYDKDVEDMAEKMSKTQVNLKLIPHVDGTLAIAQLVAYNMTEIKMKGAWKGDARLHLVPHVNAPAADLPVRKIVSGSHMIADLSLPYGKVLFDYLK